MKVLGYEILGMRSEINFFFLVDEAFSREIYGCTERKKQEGVKYNTYKQIFT